jgi:hypothetical protein
MPMNFLEQLAAEWYRFQGYHVQTNIRTNPLPGGGFGNELDVLAFHAEDHQLVHVETSGDSESWPEREKRFREKKFVFSQQQYHELTGFEPQSIRKRAVVGQGKTTIRQPDWSDIGVVTVPQFIQEVYAGLKGFDPLSSAVPEIYPCLRAIQYALAYSDL